MLSEDWLQDAGEPTGTPSSSGEWQLNRLRWELLKVALRAPPSTRLAAHIPRIRHAMVAAGLAPPIPLRSNHRADDFDCGVDLLNGLLRQSLAQVAAGAEVRLSTRVIVSGDTIVGYYSTRPVTAVCDSDPGARIPLLFVARCGVDKAWRRPGVADDMFVYMLQEAWNVPVETRPAAVFGLTVSPSAKRFFRRIGIRPLGDAIDTRGIIVPEADLRAAADELPSD